MRLPEPERQAYEKHQDDLHHQASIVKSNYDAGALDGIKQGLEQGLEQGKLAEKRAIAMSLLDVLDVKTIATKTGLSEAEIQQLKSATSQ